MNIRNFAIPLIWVVAGLTAACGSTNFPVEKLAEADIAIQQAEQVGAKDYAPLEIREARRKLDTARSAVEEEDYEKAQIYVEQALVDAELAHIKTLSGKARMAVTELRESIRILEEEINRNRLQNTN